MPPGFEFPANEQLWIPLYSEFPIRPRSDPQANNPAVIATKTKLAEAELKIQQLEKDAAGELKLKPFEAEDAQR